MKWKIPLFEIYWDEEDIKRVEKIIRSGKYWCNGSEIEEFEEKITDYLGAKYCLTFNSGGSALLALMKAHGFERGNEIIVPSFTFIATAYAPLYVDAKPVFADIEEETFGLDPEDIKEKITKKTKAIMPIHYGGIPCKIGELKEIAKDNDLLLIEDAAESFGAKYKGKYVGTFGNSAIFSFCQNKVFTTSEGGCITTNDKNVYEKAKLYRSYGRISEKDYFTCLGNLDYIEVGHNFRMSTLLASLGISQLEKVDRIIEMRRKNAEHLNKELKKIDELVVPDIPNEDYFVVYQMYTIRVLDGRKTRNRLMECLKSKGINTKIYFNPVHEYPIFKKLGYKDVTLSKTKELSSQVLTLPLYPSLSKKEIDYIIKKINNFFSKEGDND